MGALQRRYQGHRDLGGHDQGHAVRHCHPARHIWQHDGHCHSVEEQTTANDHQLLLGQSGCVGPHDSTVLYLGTSGT